MLNMEFKEKIDAMSLEDALGYKYSFYETLKTSKMYNRIALSALIVSIISIIVTINGS